MSQPRPKDVFDHPEKFVDFLQSSDFEGQYFDRKEVFADRNKLSDLRKGMFECISGFANKNWHGGLLVLGVADDGTLKGVNHLTEEQLNGLTKAPFEGLKNHLTESKLFSISIATGQTVILCLFYTAYSERSICMTADASARAWKRVGMQCLLLSDSEKEQLKRDKGIVDFESEIICEYDENEVDKNVAEEFKSSYLQSHDARYAYSLTEILYQAGAIVKKDGVYFFTKAGFLFFSIHPRRLFANAFVRFLRYDTKLEHKANPGTTTYDGDFDGPLPNLIRKIRRFVNESAFFKTYSYRGTNGAGFIQQQEYPPIAVDEAILNAVIHRDYGLTTPIKCVAYQDAFVVISPGRMLQPQYLPERFSLDKVCLESYSRNPKLVEWFRLLRDENGMAFVRALSEGTRTMLGEMQKYGLPSPEYQVDGNTVLILKN